MGLKAFNPKHENSNWQNTSRFKLRQINSSPSTWLNWYPLTKNWEIPVYASTLEFACLTIHTFIVILLIVYCCIFEPPLYVVYTQHCRLDMRIRENYKRLFWPRLPFGAVPLPPTARMSLYGMSWSPCAKQLNHQSALPHISARPGLLSAIKVPLYFGTYASPKLCLLPSFQQSRHRRALEPNCSF